jgi:hypothetical protein
MISLPDEQALLWRDLELPGNFSVSSHAPIGCYALGLARAAR